MSDIIDMHHVAMATADLEATIKFYTEIISLEARPTPSSSRPLQWPPISQISCHIADFFMMIFFQNVDLEIK